MSTNVAVFILTDGILEYWTVAVDNEKNYAAQHADIALKREIGLESSSFNFTKVEGSLGSRASHFPQLLVESIRLIDDGKNINRHHFDLVCLTEISSKPVLAIGSSRSKRGRAAKLALLCRLRYEAAMTNATTNTFTCPDLHAVFSVIRFSLPVAAHVSEPARAIRTKLLLKLVFGASLT